MEKIFQSMLAIKSIMDKFKSVYQKELDNIHIVHEDGWNFRITQKNQKYALSVSTPPDTKNYNLAETALIYEGQLMYEDKKRFGNWDELKEEIDIFMQTYWKPCYSPKLSIIPNTIKFRSIFKKDTNQTDQDLTLYVFDKNLYIDKELIIESETNTCCFYNFNHKIHETPFLFANICVEKERLLQMSLQSPFKKNIFLYEEIFNMSIVQIKPRTCYDSLGLILVLYNILDSTYKVYDWDFRIYFEMSAHKNVKDCESLIK